MISALVDNRAVVIYPTGKGGVEAPIVYTADPTSYRGARHLALDRDTEHVVTLLQMSGTWVYEEATSGFVPWKAAMASRPPSGAPETSTYPPPAWLTHGRQFSSDEDGDGPGSGGGGSTETGGGLSEPASEASRGAALPTVAEGVQRRRRYHAESTLSSAQVLKGQGTSTAFWHQATPSTRQSPPSQ